MPTSTSNPRDEDDEEEREWELELNSYRAREWFRKDRSRGGYSAKIESGANEVEAVQSVSSATRFPDADVAYSFGREIPVGGGSDGGAGNVA